VKAAPLSAGPAPLAGSAADLGGVMPSGTPAGTPIRAPIGTPIGNTVGTSVGTSVGTQVGPQVALHMALKSGNFGSVDFFAKSFALLERRA
jgi:hypothetical protein